MNAAPILENRSEVAANLHLAKIVRQLAGCALLIGVLSTSGCLGIGGTANPPNQQNQNTSASAAMAVSPPSINFGSVAVGSTVNQSVTVSNTGGSDLTVSQVSVGVAGFTVSGFSLPLTIHSGKQSTFNVVFSPKTTGNVSGGVSVISGASGSPATVNVSGNGVAATSLVNASSTSLNFGNVNIGGSGSLNVTLTNAGNSSVTISSVKISSSNFTSSGASAGMTLAPGQNVMMNVAFSPLTKANLTASVTVSSNASNSPVIISLSGSGVQPSSHSVTLSWTPSISSVAGYIVYRSLVSGGAYTKMNTSPIPASQYIDATVQAGQTYYYVATSVDLTGQESPHSNQVSVTIPLP
jgi:HYDIN/CFA65/VesB-like, Ig-like domain